MRQPGWEERLVDLLDERRAVAFRWGVTDCFTLPMDVAKAMTATDPWKSARTYKTALGARKKLGALGFKNIGDMIAARLEEIPVAIAGRGDIGVVDQDGETGGCVFAPEPTGQGKSGLIVFPRSRVLRAFKV